MSFSCDINKNKRANGPHALIEPVCSIPKCSMLASSDQPSYELFFAPNWVFDQYDKKVSCVNSTTFFFFLSYLETEKTN